MLSSSQLIAFSSMGGMPAGQSPQTILIATLQKILETQIVKDIAEPGKGVWEGNPWPALAGGLAGNAVPGSALFGPSMSVIMQISNSIAQSALAGLLASAIRSPVGDQNRELADQQRLEQAERQNTTTLTDIVATLQHMENPLGPKKMAIGGQIGDRPEQAIVHAGEVVNGIRVIRDRAVTLPAGSEVLPANIMAEAQKAALVGGQAGAFKYIRSQGIRVDQQWCGDFAAAVVKAAGGTPQKIILQRRIGKIGEFLIAPSRAISP